MASGQSNLTPPSSPPRWKRIARDVFSRVRQKPVQNATIFLAIATAITGMGVLSQLPQQPPAPTTPDESATIASAFEALDVDARENARSLAADLRLIDELPDDQRGHTAYILGIAMARDAEEEHQKNERRVRFILAARYLEESKAAGFPQGREAEGLYVLGKSLHDAKLFAQSLPILHEALAANFTRRTEVLGLLANSYLEDTQPDYDKAIEYNREFLADDALSFDDRNDAMMLQSEIFFRQEQYANCEAAVSSIPEASRHFASALMMRARLLIREGDLLALQKDDGAVWPKAIEKYEKARELLGLALVHGVTNRELGGKAQYLTGLTYRRTGPLRPTAAEESTDLRAALEQFGRTRRSHFDSPEGISSSLEESEIYGLFGEDDKSIKALRRTLRYVSASPSYNNPWISRSELKNRIEATFTKFRDAGRFDFATQIAAAMATVFSEAHAIQLQAETREAAAKQLAAESIGQPLSKAQSLLVDSRTENRNAGALYARLAKLRFTSRDHPNDLRKAAENYLRGQDYERAVRYFTDYLNTQTRSGRPPALTALGEAMLALHETKKALPYLMECIQSYPRDPHSYRARVIAAQAQRELGNLGQARVLLEANLEHETLTPRSVEWRQSLFALGELLYLEGIQLETQSRLEGVNSNLAPVRKKAIRHLEMSQKAFLESIASLDEAVFRASKRDANSRQVMEARYQIAEAYRHVAKLPRRKLETATIDTTLKKLTEERNNVLRVAEKGYGELIATLALKLEQSELSGIEHRILRNCYFARADALYDMERYEEAITAYSNATNRYQQEPESLEAFVQIANCHRRTNQPAKARGTLQQAKVILNRIRPDADFKQTTRYNRDEWVKILVWLETL
jgi:TolA-binding protein